MTALQGLANSQVVTFRLLVTDNLNTTQQQIFDNVSITAAVPEPTTFAMLLGGTGMLMLLRRRRR